MNYQEFYGPIEQPAGNQMGCHYLPLLTIIPTKIGMPTLQTEIPEEANSEAITKDLDMTDELREAAVVRIASYQQRLTNLYNIQVKPRTF